jgi:hypothetical protein
MFGPSDACRIDAGTTATVRAGKELRRIVVGCALTIVVGAAAYGATMGLWRGPLQSFYAAIKLVLFFAGVFCLTTLTNAMAASLLRARLSLPQVATCCLLGLTVTAAILGAVAPVAWFAAHHAPPIGTDYRATMQVAHGLLGGHIVVFAVAGVVGIRRMWNLLRELVPQPAVARRVLWAWLLVEGLVGAELSWILRPFLGKPHLPIAFLREDAFASSFFDEVLRITTEVGPSGPWLAAWAAVVVAIIVGLSLRDDARASFSLALDGLVVTHIGGTQSIHVPWDQIAHVQRRGRIVEVGRTDAAALRTDTIVLPCATDDAARAAYEAIELARRAPDQPFRRTGL